jgi:hypothetical protein
MIKLLNSCKHFKAIGRAPTVDNFTAVHITPPLPAAASFPLITHNRVRKAQKKHHQRAIATGKFHPLPAAKYALTDRAYSDVHSAGLVHFVSARG